MPKSATHHILVAFALLGILANQAPGSPGGWDQSYAPIVTGGPVYATAVQPDGKLLVGGAFSAVNNSFSRARLARLFGDGSLDTTFFTNGSGVSSTVYCLAVQTDGRILLGGDFVSINGTSRTRVARLNANGTVDGSFIPTNAITGSVLALAAQSDNKVIIGGNFSSSIFPLYNARLNADGSVDTVFSSFPNGPVNAIAIQTDGKILIGGAFTSVNGASRLHIARLNSDGSLDNTFQNGLTGASSTVRCIQIQPDGKILIGGDFTSVNGPSRSYVARLNSSGSLDTGFVSYPAGPSGPVYALALQPDSSVVIAGLFTSYGSANLSHVARLYADGSRDTIFTNFGINNTVQALAVQSDGGLVIGGAFTTINNTNWPSLGRLYGNLYPPEFLTQPVSRATNVGANVSFSALVSNPTPSSYQWRKDGNNISGATGTSYSLSNLQFADAGNYSVFVNNAVGGVTSSNAVLQVGTAPVITQQPVSLSVTQGQPAAFTVGAAGSPLNYYWRKNGFAIPGATNSALTFSNAVFANSASYTCLVSNFVGKTTSSVAVLTVSAPPTITLQPIGSTVGVGSNYTLTVIANGSAPLAYQWSKDSAPLVGSTDTTFTLTNAQPGDSGAYSVAITNTFGSVTSSVANVSVIFFPPSITAQPSGATLLVGSNFTLAVTATGTDPLAYQWLKDGNNLPGATTASYTVTGAQTNDTGAYTVLITNVAGSVTSSIAQVNVGYAPLIIQQPQPFTNDVGTSNAFTVVATGSDPLLYQWFKDGSPIANATNKLLPLSNLQSNQVGYYSVTITNLYGSTASSNALLSIPGVPIIFLPQGLVAYYPFNGNANDASGNGNDGTNYGATLSSDRFGNLSRAYSFDGTNNFISAVIPNLPAGTAPRTMTGWVRPVQTEDPTGTLLSAIGYGAGNGNGQFGLGVGGNPDPTLKPLLLWKGLTDWLPNLTMPVNTWSFIAVTYSNQAVTVWLNNSNTNWTGCDQYGCIDTSNNQKLFIGAVSVDGQTPSAPPGGFKTWYAGAIDDVHVYNRALSSNEVSQLYAYEADLPTITTQPLPKIVSQGSTVSFTVAAIAQNPLTYQWSKDGLSIPAATNATLLLTNVQPSQAGFYTVTISNGFTGVVSASAALSVMSSLGAGAPGFTSNQFGFGLSSAIGATLVVESSTNLLNWHPVLTNIFVTNTFQFLDPASTSNRIGFYRVRAN